MRPRRNSAALVAHYDQIKAEQLEAVRKLEPGETAVLVIVNREHVYVSACHLPLELRDDRDRLLALIYGLRIAVDDLTDRCASAATALLLMDLEGVELTDEEEE